MTVSTRSLCGISGFTATVRKNLESRRGRYMKIISSSISVMRTFNLVGELKPAEIQYIECAYVEWQRL